MRTARYVVMMIAANMVGPNLVFAYALRSDGNLIAANAALAIFLACGAWLLVEKRSSKASS